MPLPRSPRRLEEDPENEPDLYAISNLYPLPSLDDARNRDLEAVVQYQVPFASSEQHQAGTGTFIAPRMASFVPANGLFGYPHQAPKTYAATTPHQFETYPDFGSLSTFATNHATTDGAGRFGTPAPAPTQQYDGQQYALINSNGYQQQQFRTSVVPGAFSASAHHRSTNFAPGFLTASASPTGTPLYQVISPEFGNYYV
jgi:hypothetical protein